MELMREMHEMAGRHAQQEAQWRERELERTVRQEMEERQVKINMRRNRTRTSAAEPS